MSKPFMNATKLLMDKMYKGNFTKSSLFNIGDEVEVTADFPDGSPAKKGDLGKIVYNGAAPLWYDIGIYGSKRWTLSPNSFKLTGTKSLPPGTKVEEDSFYETYSPWIAPKCECGVSAVNGNKHSDYCPLYHLQFVVWPINH